MSHKNKLPAIIGTFNLSSGENKIVTDYKISNGLQTKQQAIKLIIVEHKEQYSFIDSFTKAIKKLLLGRVKVRPNKKIVDNFLGVRK